MLKNGGLVANLLYVNSNASDGREETNMVIGRRPALPPFTD